MSSPPDLILSFGKFELNLRTSELRKAGRIISLPPQPFRILALLAARAGQLVTREEIQSQIWGNETFVDFEKGLNFAIRKIRIALGDNSDSPRYIETLPRRGYRFIGTIETIKPGSAASEGSGASPVVPISEAIALSQRKAARHGVALAVVPRPEAAPSRAGATQDVLQVMSRPPRRRWSARILILIGALMVFVIVLVSPFKFWRPGREVPVARKIQSLAVLPVSNISFCLEPNDSYGMMAYHADVFTNRLIGALKSIPHLRLNNQAKMIRYKGNGSLAPEIAGQLGVDAILKITTGCLIERISIKASLIAPSGKILWESNYSSNKNELSKLPDQLVTDLARQIGLDRGPYTNLSDSAFRSGISAWNERTASSLIQSAFHFSEAIRRNPSDGRAYAGLAGAYAEFADYDIGEPRDSYSMAKDAAQEALRLDNQLGDAHATLGKISSEFGWDWPAAEIEFQHALEISPESVTVHQWYSEYLLKTKRFIEAILEMKKAVELSHDEARIIAELGATYYWTGQFERAKRYLDRAISLDPNFAYAHSWRGFVYEQTKRPQDAIREFDRAVKLSGGSPFFKAALGYAYGCSDQVEKALTAAHELEVLATQRYISPYNIALVYIGLGNKDQALIWLNRAFEGSDPGLDLLAVEPAFHALWNNRDFLDLLHKINLPPPKQMPSIKKS